MKAPPAIVTSSGRTVSFEKAPSAGTSRNDSSPGMQDIRVGSRCTIRSTTSNSPDSCAGQAPLQGDGLTWRQVPVV